ncbi:DbpA RNA binding domain-containing protein, partial [Klebsiella pneumoniae]
TMDEMGAVGNIEQMQGSPSVWYPLDELTPTPGGRLLPSKATIHINASRKDKIRPGDVLGALTADLGYTREQVGKIDINEFAT